MASQAAKPAYPDRGVPPPDAVQQTAAKVEAAAPCHHFDHCEAESGKGEQDAEAGRVARRIGGFEDREAI